MTNESADETDSLNKNEKKDIPDSEVEGLPIDKGWAWVVLAGKRSHVSVYGYTTKLHAFIVNENKTCDKWLQ